MTLEEIAKKMCAKGKGILAADESTGTIAKRFKSINVENTEKNRLVFRQTLFSSEAMKNYIGGVILFDETIKQKTTIGPTVPELISKNNAIPGIALFFRIRSGILGPIVVFCFMVSSKRITPPI